MVTGWTAEITQALGSHFTLNIGGQLVRLRGTDADAIGKPVPQPLPAREDDGADLQTRIWRVLGTCYDPEIPVVNDLLRQGLLETTRGRGGGVRLLMPADAIGIGDVVRAAETDFRLVECFDETTNACTLSPSCRMKRLLDSALAAYFRELDGATLAGLVGPPTRRGRPGAGIVIPIKAETRKPAGGARS